MRLLTLVLVALCTLSVTRGSAAAQAASPYDTGYFEQPGFTQPSFPPPAWSSIDEEWLERNRTFALTGKILTVLGFCGLIVALSMAGESIEEPALYATSLAVQTLGQFMWSIAELRAAKQLRRRGVYVSKAAGVAAVVGASLLSPVFAPIVWIAGPVQSARIREARESLSYSDRAGLSSRGERVSSFGFGLRISL